MQVTPGFRMPAFSPAIAVDGVAEILLVVERDGRDDAEARRVNDVGGVEAAAEADFEQGEIGRRLGEGEKGGRRGDLEEGDLLAAIGLFAAFEKSDQTVLVDQVAGDADAFMEAREVRRGVDVDAVATRLEPRADHRDGRAFAVGAGDVDHRRQAAFGMAERGQKPFDPTERQVDDLRVQRHQAFEDAVARRVHGTGAGSIGPGAGSSPWTGGGCLVRSRRIVASSIRSFPRSMTRSSMPWSSRYSARWKPSGRVSRMVCSITRGPAKQMSALGSAIWTSPSMA